MQVALTVNGTGHLAFLPVSTDGRNCHGTET